MAGQMRRNDVEAWARAVANAWETRDAESAALLFKNAEQYYETPFSRNYAASEHGIVNLWREVEKQDKVQVDVEVMAVDGELACVQYSATYVLRGKHNKTAGIWLAKFVDGRCTQFKMFSVSAPTTSEGGLA